MNAIGKVKSTRARGFVVLFIALALISAWIPGPASAQGITTTTSTLVNRFGNTVTTTDTSVGGVLVSRDSREVRPDGTLTLVKHWDFHADGITVKSYVEQRVDGFAPYKIDRQFDASGVLRFQSAELSINGQLTVQSFMNFDAQGFLVTKEERNLTTLPDGTKVWSVTYETWSGLTLVSSRVAQFPLGHNFNVQGNAPVPAPGGPQTTQGNQAAGDDEDEDDEDDDDDDDDDDGDDDDDNDGDDDHEDESDEGDDD